MLGAGNRHRGELLFVVASYTTPLVGLFASAIAAMSMSPIQMGSIQSVLLLGNYLSMLHLGAFHGLNRNLAFYFGKGERETGLRMVSAAHFIARLNALAGLVFAIGVWGFVMRRGMGPLSVYSALALALIQYCTPYVTHISTTCRSGQHFAAMGRITLAANAARMAHAMLPRFIGWMGYLVSLVLDAAIRLALFKRVEPYPPSRPFHAEDMLELLRVGFPIMAIGYVSSLLLVADQSLLALFCSASDLGSYTPARLVTVAVMTVPATLTVILSPKVAARFGAGGTPAALRRPFWIVLALHMGLVAPLCVAASIFVGPVVRSLMPQYEAGITASRVAALACIGLVGNGALIITTTLRDNQPSLWIQSISLAAIWGGGALLGLTGRLSLEQAAWLRLCVSWAGCLAMWAHAYVAVRRPGAPAGSPATPAAEGEAV